MAKPAIGISIGDPAGIGPELISKVLKSKKFEKTCNLKLIADDSYYQAKSKLKMGIPTALSGDIAFKSFLKAVDLVRKKELAAIVTAPISKLAWQMAGHFYQGHTDLLAELTKVKDYAMFFYSKKLSIILSTIHCPLKMVPRLLTQESIVKKIILAIKAMQKLGIAHPRVAVAGLNPHAGEDGILGTEENKIIKPAIKKLQNLGFDVKGPIAPDIVFKDALAKKYDLVNAQYHDQGLIPLKMVDFEKAVNITLGLPIIRTSPDHGVAYDIAGKNIADHQSLEMAIKLATKLI